MVIVYHVLIFIFSIMTRLNGKIQPALINKPRQTGNKAINKKIPPMTSPTSSAFKKAFNEAKQKPVANAKKKTVIKTNTSDNTNKGVAFLFMISFLFFLFFHELSVLFTNYLILIFCNRIK